MLMHGREGENRKPSRHMWSVSSRGCATTTKTVVVDWDGSSTNCFSKDGRKISVGDCALFKPPHDSPPFIGIIRWLTKDRENNLKLVVNWLYRPSEVKLGKGVALEAAPNEVFYSFHRDEILAASLLHPCKVAFLPKGVELASGISCFVCRRVYDITNKCLWWLTDQDYINVRQEEVDQLLLKTSTEMHATFQQQQGSRSPKSLNGQAVTSPIKLSPDSVQNSSALSSQVKGKKRDRGDLASEPMKRERSLKSDDGDSGQLRSENMLKLEISKLAEKGGLVDSQGVERLVQLLQAEKPERKLDLACRSMLAGIIAATDKFDCLIQFVQLRGLPVLNGWLQEVHKGKIGDSSISKDIEKSVEDFLLVLLRALAKLPVNLDALQTCHIGKSVNHLRSHKNSEIQKKARSLVDTWKKRVEAEMTSNDVKSGSAQAVPWAARSRHEVSHGGNRHFNGSSEAAIRSSVTQISSSKSAPVKIAPGEMTLKTASASVGSQKSSLPVPTVANLKDGQTRISVAGGNSDPPLSVPKEEKSSSSSQSHTNSQCSSDLAKNMVPSGKEDARSSTAGSRNNSKIMVSTSRHRKSGSVLQGTSISGVQRETGSSRNSCLAGISSSEKLSQSVVMCENTTDAPLVESNNHKLIVKIPNRGRSPAQSVSGGPVEDPSCRNSRASSPALSEKQEQSEVSAREKSDDQQTKESNGSPAAPPDKKYSWAGNDISESPDNSKSAYLSSGNIIKSRKPIDPSYNSINALIESCVKYSEANASMSVGDDVGMNLLASVAAGEMCSDDAVSPTLSPKRNTGDVNGTCTEIYGISQSNDGESCKHSSISGEDSWRNRDPSLKINGSLNDSMADGSGLVSSACMVRSGCFGVIEQLPLKNAAVNDESHDQVPDTGQRLDCGLAAEVKTKDPSISEEMPNKAAEDILLIPSSDCDIGLNNVDHKLNNVLPIEQKPPALPLCSESMNTYEQPSMVSSFTHNDLVTEKSGEIKAETTDDQGESRTVQDNYTPLTAQKQEDSGLGSAASDQRTLCEDENLESNQVVAQHSGQSIIQNSSSASSIRDREPHLIAKSFDTSVAGEQKHASSPTEEDTCSLSAADGTDGDVKLEFDLNEGFNVDDGKNGELPSLSAPQCPSSVSLISPLHFPVSSATGSLPAAITVASAAKGAFVPPEDLLRNKNELGWKGSAATSAFRPAEPRKVLEMAQGTNKASLRDATASKQVRPLLDIDLNVADERILQDVVSQNTTQVIDLKPGYKNDYGLTGELMSSESIRCCGGIDLDLNRIDEASEFGQHPPSNGQRSEVSSQPVKLSSSSFPTNAASVWRDFDLNNGPAVDEITVEASPYHQHTRGIVPPQPPNGVRLNGTGIGNFSMWYLPGSAYSAVTTPSALPDRGDQSFPVIGIGGSHQRLLNGPTTSASFNPDLYRGLGLSSSPVVPFPSNPFQYSVFPFGTSFPLHTSTLSGGSAAYLDPSSGGRICPQAVPTQLLGTSAISSQYPRPGITSLPDLSNNGAVENSQKWGRQGLDLNSGPGGPDVGGRDEVLPVASRQLTTVTSQAVVEDQARLYHVAGLKRKEPDGGWDDRLNYKQSSWQ
ncbi:hypothetical protein Ancab_035751 [Ancistrocladus abbreviatus]